MIKIDEGNFSAKGTRHKLDVEFEVLCRCYREMLAERLGEDEANTTFDKLIANSKMPEEERLELVKKNHLEALDSLFRELAERFSEEDEEEEEDKAEAKQDTETKQEEPYDKKSFADFLSDFLKF